MNQEFIVALKEIVKDKGISEDLIFTTIEDALVAAYKKNYASPTTSAQNVKVSINRETGEIHVYAQKVVVEDVYDYVTEISIEEAKNAISDSAGCVLADDTTNGIYPMPIDSSDKDSVLVGRVRRDDTFPCGISLFCCGDQIRKGAATNAVQIAELLVQQ